MAWRDLAWLGLALFGVAWTKPCPGQTLPAKPCGDAGLRLDFDTIHRYCQIVHKCARHLNPKNLQADHRWTYIRSTGCDKRITADWAPGQTNGLALAWHGLAWHGVTWPGLA